MKHLYALRWPQGGAGIFRHVAGLLLLLLGLATAATAQMTYTTVGQAVSQGGNCYQITPPVNSAVGAFWSNSTITLASNFDLSFSTSIGGADGIMFVLHSGAANANPNSVGSGLNYYGSGNSVLDKSLGLELDTYNSGSGGTYNDPSDSHLALVKNGSSLPIVPPVNIPVTGTRTLRLVWTASTTTLVVFLDGVQRMSLTENLVATTFANNPNVRFGFTGACGGAVAQQNVCLGALTYTLTPPPPAITSLSPTSAPAGTSVTLTGTDLTGATSVRVNGVAVTPTSVTSTSLSFVVPAGASATPSITVTTPGGTSAASTAFTVLLNVAGTSPAANARTAPTASSATAVTFTEPVTAASAASLKVFSSQLGGRKAGTVTVAGSTASFAATASTLRTSFKPGETVTVTVPASVQNAGGLAVSKRVYQFTTAVGGPGRGNFTGTHNASISNSIQFVTVGDLDGDGDLDLLTANTGTALVTVRFNDGTGTYSGGATSRWAAPPREWCWATLTATATSTL